MILWIAVQLHGCLTRFHIDGTHEAQHFVGFLRLIQEFVHLIIVCLKLLDESVSKSLAAWSVPLLQLLRHKGLNWYIVQLDLQAQLASQDSDLPLYISSTQIITRVGLGEAFLFRFFHYL
eukprot:Skav235568  [mRNA]  locus=scaffold612:15472:17799:- [translate_table: standard]